jgi:hypothetical protein
VTTLIGFCFAIGLALSAIAGAATFAEAAMHLFRAACASAVEKLERSLNRTAGSEAAIDEEFGRPRVRWL